MNHGDPELASVRLSDIVEFPTELGNRCLYLREMGIDPYRNTEEELMNALMDSVKRSDWQNICTKSSRCAAFLSKFQQGITPFMERDPIQLLTFQGRYWVCEGKHRVCMAMRSGVERIRAYVYPLSKDSQTLLPTEGKPGFYRFHHGTVNGQTKQSQGEIAILWIGGTPGVPPCRFTLSPAFLDENHNTNGKPITILPGITYSVTHAVKRSGLFGRTKTSSTNTVVDIDKHHRNTRVWLMKIPAAKVTSNHLRHDSVSVTQTKTLYRTGCWRNHHLTSFVSTLY